MEEMELDKDGSSHLDSSLVSKDEETSDTSQITVDIKNNGIFDFMTPERAIELYNRIHSSGPPELDWKFYGRRNLDDKNTDDMIDINVAKDEVFLSENSHGQIPIPEFDFDEDLGDFLNDTSSIMNEGLQLKKRPEPGNEKKTNLSDIMIDIMKEINMDNE